MHVFAWSRLRYLLLALALLVLAGCAASERAPEASFTTLDGKPTSLAQLRGKVVLVNFWATSCPGCIKEMPMLSAVQQRYGPQGYATVAVAMGYDPIDYVKTYVGRNSLPFLVTHDADGKVAQAFGGIMATPTSFLLDKHGNIARRYMGEPDRNELSGEIERLLHD